ncbi:MAG: PAS domain S-box protein [Magnetospirillum sp. WYHS-4]
MDTGSASRAKARSTTFRSLVVAAGVAWTAVVGGFLAWHLVEARANVLALARNEARTNVNKDIAFRFWATRHGGVYVPADQRTLPNPYLSHVPERDIRTPEGRNLTLMNPAYMLRQMMGEYDELFGVKGRIVSLKPLNPVNTPDDWEQSVLKAFERGHEEQSELVDIDGQPYLRLMRRLVTEPGCLKCHAHQGYRIGDVRGGVGVAVPMRPFWERLDHERLFAFVSHGVIWLIGLGAIGLLGREGGRRLSEREEGQARLLESQALFAAVFDNAGDAILVHDLEGRIVDANRQACQTLGYVREDLNGLRVADYEHDHCADEARRFWDDLPLGESRSFGASHFSRKDGSIFPVEVHGCRMRFGERDLIVAVARDTTTQRKAQESLERSNAELQRFAYVASHDLQEPLRTVTNYVQLLEKRYGPQLDSDAREYIGFASHAAKRMRSLILDLLAYSRLETDAKPLVAMDAGLALAEALDGLQGAIAETGAEIHQTEMPRVQGDFGQVSSLFQNLIGNALKYRDADRKPVIAIGAVQADGEWLFHVRDNGIGFDPQYADRIFKVFQRLPNPGKPDGSGIGLAICKKVVERHGGRIWVETQPGKGATFWFTLCPAVT